MTDNFGSNNVIIAYKINRQASKCANCLAKKSILLKQKSNKKTGWDKTNSKFFIY